MASGITRRHFLKQGTLAAAALSAAPLALLGEPRKPLKSAGRLQKVMVVGAGLAGLSAAYELVQAGHRVTLLEAQLRAGGRVQTFRAPFADGLYADAGAARIPDFHEWTLSYVKHFNLTLEPFYPSEGSSVYFIRGRRYKCRVGESLALSDLPLELTPEERKLGLAGLDEKYVVPALKRLGDPSAAEWPPESLKEYDRMTWLEFLRRQGASPGAIALLELGSAFAGDSALDYLRDDFSHHAKSLYKIQGGNDLLPGAFASRLAQNISYGSPVVRIEQSAQGVRVTFLQGGSPQTLTADHLVCAIPFSVLRRIEISPPFSPEKQRAINELKYDPVVRMFLQTRRKFWLDEGANGFALTDHPMEIWDPTWNQAGPRGILVSYMMDTLGGRMTELAADKRANTVVEEMEKVHPGLRDNLEGVVTKAWAEDEWARGAYAVFDPGQITSLGPHIARPEGRVHFAGEHASSWPGWMQGALESGNRVAREINEAA